jgi:hypothetical protein
MNPSDSSLMNVVPMKHSIGAHASAERVDHFALARGIRDSAQPSAAEGS